MIQALILFGSHARGDNQRDSDLDLIAVVEEAPSKPFEKESLSISFYSKKFLVKISADGNLFALHLTREAIPITDPDNVLVEMRRAFTAKNSYDKDISDASMLGWFLIRHSNKVQNWNLFNKRIAWCVRTIIIATAFTKTGHAIFSAQALSHFANDKNADWLISQKASSSFDEQTRFRLARFLQAFGLGDPGIYNIDDINTHIDYIFRSGNIVGKNTISSLFGGPYSEYVFERRAPELNSAEMTQRRDATAKLPRPA